MNKRKLWATLMMGTMMSMAVADDGGGHTTPQEPADAQPPVPIAAEPRPGDVVNEGDVELPIPIAAEPVQTINDVYRQTLSEVAEFAAAVNANLLQLQTDAPMVQTHPLVMISLLRLENIRKTIETALL